MGFDFDVGALASGALFHGSTFNGKSATLEITNGATATQADGATATVGTLILGTTAGSGAYSLSGRGSCPHNMMNLSAFPGRETSRSPAGATSSPAISRSVTTPAAAVPTTSADPGSCPLRRVRGLLRHGELHAVRRHQRRLRRLNLGFYPGSSGTYNLNGGILVLPAIYSGSGAAAFNFGGGTLQASGPLKTTLPMTLTGSGGNATVDTAGYAVTLSGSLSGPGGLTKTGGGTLVLGGANNYTGGTTVAAARSTSRRRMPRLARAS